MASPEDFGLPPIVMPTELLRLLSTPHDVEEEDVYGQIEFQTGPRRGRKLFTGADRKMQIGMLLNQDRLAIFHDWYENALDAGSKPFSIQVQDFGPDLVWFKAYMPKYRSDHQADTMCALITASVYLIGDPVYISPIDSSGEMWCDITVPVLADIVIGPGENSPVLFTVDLTVPVTASVGSLPFEATIGVIPVEAIVYADPSLPPGVILRQSARTYTAPDGDDVLLRLSARDYTPPTVII